MSGGTGSSRESIFRFLLGVAMVILLHSAYSVAEWRSLMRKNTPSDEEEAMTSHHEQVLPLDIAIETAMGFVLAMLCVLNIAGDFMEIRSGVEMRKRTWEDVGNRPSFYVYNHRGKAFSPFYDPPSSPASSGKRSVLDIPEKFLS